jgi:hypothetical protein
VDKAVLTNQVVQTAPGCSSYTMTLQLYLLTLPDSHSNANPSTSPDDLFWLLLVDASASAFGHAVILDDAC